MNVSTTSPLGQDFMKQIVDGFQNAIDEGTKEAARMIWSLAISTLTEHWLLIAGVFVMVLVFFFLLALIGQWGSLYSLTYWTLYGIVVLFIGLIFGPETFVGDWYGPIYLIIIWPVCYRLTGWIWDRFEFRRKRW